MSKQQYYLFSIEKISHREFGQISQGSTTWEQKSHYANLTPSPTRGSLLTIGSNKHKVEEYRVDNQQEIPKLPQYITKLLQQIKSHVCAEQQCDFLEKIQLHINDASYNPMTWVHIIVALTVRYKLGTKNGVLELLQSQLCTEVRQELKSP